MKNMYHVFFALFAASAAFGATVDLSTLTANYEAQDGDVLTGTLDGENNPRKITIADGAKVTLSDAKINGYICESDEDPNCHEWAGLTCLGNCTIVLKGSNTVSSFYYDYPGIQVAKNEGAGDEYTLTIEGDGSLNASSNGSAAGIGGAVFANCGNIIIASGKVTATSNEYGAGIGSGDGGTCGDITISGGEVTATGGFDAAGIGSGADGKSGAITISGGEVTATGGTEGAGIGSGCDGKSGNITITNGVTKVVATKGDYAPYSVGKGYGDKASVGSITIGGKVVDPIEDSPYEFVPVLVDLATLTSAYTAQDGDVLTGTLGGNYKITIANNAKVTLSDVTINGEKNSAYTWAGLTCLGNCTIVLKGTNTVKGFNGNYPGIQAAKNAGEGGEYTLTIEGDGSLDASSNGRGAGIGGGFNVSNGNITISGGKVIATGGSSAAGIGSGYYGTSGAITISGGDVTATGGSSAAGIGAGYNGTSGNITISGGEVTATGGSGAAGIGSGVDGTCGKITITNDVTKVVATKGSDAPYSVGKGSGNKAGFGTITIGGVEMETSVAKELFVFPYPTTLVDFETVGDKKYAIVDGNYSGEGPLSITTDENVDKVIFVRTFPVVEGENNYSTIMFPFEIKASEVGNIKSVVSFLGIGAKDNHKIVAVERVWCDDNSKEECNYSTAKFEAYKPYLIQLESGKTSVAINNTSPLVIKATPTALDAFDVAQSNGYNQYGDYVFRGVIQTKNWGASDPDVLGTNGAAAYGFAGTAATGIDVGQFVKVAEGAYIQPFRGYIYKKVPQAVKGTYALRQTASIDNDIPETMNVVVVDRKKDGEEQTTVIGQFNSRTGEIRLNRAMRTYDLKGRSVRDASRMAKGVYFKK